MLLLHVEEGDLELIHFWDEDSLVEIEEGVCFVAEGYSVLVLLETVGEFVVDAEYIIESIDRFLWVERHHVIECADDNLIDKIPLKKMRLQVHDIEY